MDNITIAGAGLVGSLLGVYLGKRGHTVNIYERRPDLRKLQNYGGRSINLALSDRGWRALEEVGLREKVAKIAIPMYGRMIHHQDGSTVFQPYGKAEQAIYSVSRSEINNIMLNAADEHPNVHLHFNQACIGVQAKGQSTISFEDRETKAVHTACPKVIFGADGAFSRVRQDLQRMSRFNYEQAYLPHGYKELYIPPAKGGGYSIEKNALHIWPRRSFMLIALPNLDGSFTCTLFLAFEGAVSFEQLNTKAAVSNFFSTYFADALTHMPSLVNDFFDNPTSALVTIRCNPWVRNNNIALIGDASHAIVPFYGQGMNAGFEDCRVLSDIIDAHTQNNNTDWTAALQAYQKSRIPDANAIADLALRNFIEMRDSVADAQFLLRKKIGQYLHKKYGDRYLPMYAMVTFSHLPYSHALAISKRQDLFFSALFKQFPTLSNQWHTGELDNAFERLLLELDLLS